MLHTYRHCLTHMAYCELCNYHITNQPTNNQINYATNAANDTPLLFAQPILVTPDAGQDASTSLQVPSDLFITYTCMGLKDNRISHTQYAPSYPLTAIFCTKPTTQPTTLHAAAQHHNHRPTTNRNNSNHGASPDNRLHRADSLACNQTGSHRTFPDNTLPRQTHSSAASPDNTLPRRTHSSAASLVNKLPRRTHSPAVSPDICTTPDNQLPGANSLARSYTEPHCVATSPTDYHGTLAPVAGHNDPLLLFAQPPPQGFSTTPTRPGKSHHPTAPPPQGQTRQPTAPCNTTSSVLQSSTATTSRTTTNSFAPQGGDVATQLVSHIHSIRVHSRPPKATHSKHSRSHHDQSQVGTQRPITVIASARGTRSENKRTVLAWCVPRRVDPSAVPFDQSQSINKSKCRTTQYSAATTNQCFTHTGIV